MTTHIFVGYDTREHAAWLVCKDSLLNAADGKPYNDVQVHALTHKDLRRRGLFTRPWRMDETGQMWDQRDGRPFSTEFSHTRFMVPALAREMGVTEGHVIFVDCDFLFLSPISRLIDQIDASKAVSVVKHDVERIQEGVKMDGVVQQRYPRKLWSSLMVFNMDHPDTRLFNTHFADTWSGSSLHGLTPFDDAEIGAIDGSWNWIPGMSPRYRDTPDAVHWSLGGPWMEGYEDTLFAGEWRKRYRELIENMLANRTLADTFALV